MDRLLGWAIFYAAAFYLATYMDMEVDVADGDAWTWRGGRREKGRCIR